MVAMRWLLAVGVGVVACGGGSDQSPAGGSGNVNGAGTSNAAGSTGRSGAGGRGDAGSPGSNVNSRGGNGRAGESTGGAANTADAGAAGASAGVPAAAGEGAGGVVNGASGSSGAPDAGTNAGGGAGEAGESGAGNVHPNDPPGVFEPGEVYIWGNLDYSCPGDAIVPWWSGDTIETGFPCEPYFVDPVLPRVVDPKSKRLIYGLMDAADHTELVAFTPDGDGSGQYPSSPEANDPYVTTGCSNEHGFMVDPAGNGIVYRCDDGDVADSYPYYWQDGEELAIADGYTPLVLGYQGTILVKDSLGKLGIQNATGDVALLDAQPVFGFSPVAVRARPDGFWILRTDVGLERWTAKFDGTFTSDGAYRMAAPGCSIKPFALDATGAAFCILGATPRQLARMRLGGDSTVVYTEGPEAPGLLAGAELVTGP